MTNASDTRAIAPGARQPEHPSLTAAARADLQRRLEQERTTLLARTASDDRDVLLESTATRGQGETEHTVNEIERSVHAVLDANAEEALAEIDAALARLDEGTYGWCAECSKPVPAERLVAVPAARCCVRCQQAHTGRR